jgi:phosphoenolpyruvate-protein phosphotransferase
VGKTIHGIGASSGITIGPVWIYNPIEVRVKRLQNQDPASEISRLTEAISQAKNQLLTLYKKALEEIGAEEAAIFDAHILFLDDPEFIKSIHIKLKEECVNAEAAVEEEVERFAARMLALKDEYFQARAQDIRDVGRRIIYCLSGVDTEAISKPNKPVIIVADDLTPSDTVQFDRESILGFCIRKGGPTSHTAILARSLGVPAAVSVPFRFEDIENCQLLILNGDSGMLTINPDEEQCGYAEQEIDSRTSQWKLQLEAASQPATSKDGATFEIVANIGNISDAKQAVEFGAEGVGLLRTEFLYLDRLSMPTEEEQVESYGEIFDVMGSRPVVVRTLDIGGDKAVEYLGLREETNPFLGWRAIRMISEKPEVLSGQYRALLRAGVNTDLRIMIPLVSSIEEVVLARQLLEKARKALSEENIPQAEMLQFGIMVEVPSAALLVEHIARHVDFFSIGTNDLTQYTLAVDRTNERVADLASPFHPSVIRLIARTIEKAHDHGKWVGLCGEMAGDPCAIPLLIGLGLDEFSMAPVRIPPVKEIIRKLDKKWCEDIADKAMQFSSTDEVVMLLNSSVG